MMRIPRRVGFWGGVCLGPLLAGLAAAPTSGVELQAGDIVVSDTRGPSPPLGIGPGALLKVDPTTGEQTLIAAGSFEPGGFRSPQGIAYDVDGSLVVAGFDEQRQTGALFRIDPASGAQRVVASGARLRVGRALAIESGGAILVGDLTGGAILRVQPDGRQSTLSSGGLLGNPEGLAVGPDGSIWVVDSLSKSLLRIDPRSGSQLLVSAGGHFLNPSGVSVAPDGSLLVSDENCCALPGEDPFPGGVIRVDPSTGAQSIVARAGFFSRGVRGIALEPTGSLLVAERVAGALIRVDPGNGLQQRLASGDNIQEPIGVVVVPECGNAIVEPPEQCDDGNAAGGDGCTASCQLERLDPRCSDTLNKGFAQVAKARSKLLLRCASTWAAGGASADACAAAVDARLVRLRERLVRAAASRCEAGGTPFGPADPEVVSDAAAQATLALTHDLFGPALDAALALRADGAGASCQQQTLQAAYKCQDAHIAAWNRCKQLGLREGVIRSAADLAECIGSFASAPVERACGPEPGRLGKAVARGCASRGVDLSEHFPACGRDEPAALLECLEDAVACRVCEALASADRLELGCDTCR